jgi:hypothetical protein
MLMGLFAILGVKTKFSDFVAVLSSSQCRRAPAMLLMVRMVIR